MALRSCRSIRQVAAPCSGALGDCTGQSQLIVTQAWKQTLPPSESDAVLSRQQVFHCKHLSCKICFNVLNYVFILFISNLYCLVNFNSVITTILADII